MLGAVIGVFGNGPKAKVEPAIELNTLPARAVARKIPNPPEKLSVNRPAIMLSTRRGNVHCKPRPASEADLQLVQRSGTLHQTFPFAASRLPQGFPVQEQFMPGRLHIATPMKHMGDEALYRKPTRSKPATPRRPAAIGCQIGLSNRLPIFIA